MTPDQPPLTGDLLAAEINTLPERVRRFIHALESDADPAGDKRQLELQKDLIAELQAAVATLTAELETARKERYTPGILRCAKCKFEGSYRNLNMAVGTVTANDEAQSCPNGCGPLWRVSERERRVYWEEAYEELFTRTLAAESSRDAALKALAMLVDLSEQQDSEHGVDGDAFDAAMEVARALTTPPASGP